MDVVSILNIVGRAVQLAEPFAGLVAGGNEDAQSAIDSIFKVVNTASGIGMKAIETDERLALKLEALTAELDAIEARGGLTRADMQTLADRVNDAEAELQAVLARRQALAGA